MDDQTDTNFIAPPLRMHFYRSKSTLYRLKSVSMHLEEPSLGALAEMHFELIHVFFRGRRTCKLKEESAVMCVVRFPLIEL